MLGLKLSVHPCRHILRICYCGGGNRISFECVEYRIVYPTYILMRGNLPSLKVVFSPRTSHPITNKIIYWLSCNTFLKVIVRVSE